MKELEKLKAACEESGVDYTEALETVIENVRHTASQRGAAWRNNSHDLREMKKYRDSARALGRAEAFEQIVSRIDAAVGNQ